MLRRIRKKIKSIPEFGQWMLGFKFEPFPSLSIGFSSFIELHPPKDRFWADPHIVYDNGCYYIFIEEFLYRKKIGHISYFKIKKDGSYTIPQKIISKPYHLSYPFIFYHESNYYLIPESFDHNSIELYKCVSFPDQWEHILNMFSSVNAMDTTLFFRDHKFWLFTTIVEQDRKGLYLFYSEALFSEKWASHPLNPISLDLNQSRSAGAIFEKDGELFRPSQDCSKCYGYAININRITKLTETEYREEFVSKIEPDPTLKIIRTHTYSFAPGILMIDYMKMRRRNILNIISKFRIKK